MKSYGKELILDIYYCNPKKFTKKQLKKFFKELCEKINMERCDLHFWGYDNPVEYKEAPPHLKGTSAIQFISTSNITVHALDELKRVYINVFSCKNFSYKKAQRFCEKYFEGKTVNSSKIYRI